MQIEIEEDDLIALSQIVDETYSGLLLERQMVAQGKPRDIAKEVLPDMLFTTARLLLILSKKIHENKLCSCPDDTNIMRQELVYRETFKNQIALRDWWGKRFSSNHQLRIASPQSPTYELKTVQERPKPQSGQDKPQV